MVTQGFDGLRDVFEALPSGILFYDPDGNLLFMNRRAYELLRLEGDKRFHHLDELPQALSPLRTTLQNAVGDIARSEAQLSLPGGEETFGFTLKAVHLSGESPQEPSRDVWILIFNNITQIVQSQRALEKIRDELYQSKKLASIGTMISGVAHELNNPLTGISMSTQLARMALKRWSQTAVGASADSETAALARTTLSELAKIEREAQKASTLVTELLNFSRPTKLKLTLENMSRLAEDTIEALRTHPGFARLKLTLDKPDRDLDVLCDRIKIEQVFYNLFKNACEATGGVGPIHVWFDERYDGKERQRFAVAHVRDGGPGIDPTALSRIFDPFFTTKGAEGVGLGLSISYRTLEQHGGMLSVKSHPGQGSVFSVALPLFDDEPAQILE
ncbi:MAG: PAS domain-containing protein [Vampirovibrionales bacterium]|nr:PAS domain-containing protein [Vampirovibrionales bacterium]